MMMQALEAAGVMPYATHHRPADRHNQMGYYEHEDVMSLMSLDCPQGMAVKFLGLIAAVRMPRVEAKKVIMRRNFDSMTASQESAFGVKFDDFTGFIEDLHGDAFVADYDELVDSLDFSGVSMHLGLDGLKMSSAVRRELRRY